jgi:hypothetical protein
VVGSDIHYPNHPTRGIFISQQVLQELDEMSAVLLFSRGSGDGVLNPIVTPKNVHFLPGAGLGG